MEINAPSAKYIRRLFNTPIPGRLPYCPSCQSLVHWTITVVLALVAIGAVFVFSAGMGLSRGQEVLNPLRNQGLRQLVLLPLAVLVLLGFARLDHRLFSFSRGPWPSVTTYFLVGVAVLLLLTLIPGIGVERNGARRWLSVGFGVFRLTCQPSELAKWAVVFFIAAASARLGFKIDHFWAQLVPILAVAGLLIGLVLVEDFGSAALIALLAFLLLIAGRAKWWHMVILAVAGFIIFGLALIASPYRIQRLIAYRRPDRWAQTVGYQADQSLIAIGSGGLLGKGLGNGVSKYGHLPEDTTDFVFSVIAEELGLMGTSLVIGLFIILIYLGLATVIATKDPFSKILAFGITTTIGLQAVLNIAVVTVLMPTKGLPLPFVSGGGTSLLASSAAVGILLNIIGTADQSGQPCPKTERLSNQSQS